MLISRIVISLLLVFYFVPLAAVAGTGAGAPLTDDCAGVTFGAGVVVVVGTLDDVGAGAAAACAAGGGAAAGPGIVGVDFV